MTYTDSSFSKNVTGAVQVITASDIPGINDFTTRSSAPEPVIINITATILRNNFFVIYKGYS